MQHSNPNFELQAHIEKVHMGLTSEDINSMAYALMFKKVFNDELLPQIKQIISLILAMADESKAISMPAYTHGQIASPTTMGKELANISSRFTAIYLELVNMPFKAKMNGATGSYHALAEAYPKIEWPSVIQQFISEFGIVQNQMTTQIEPHDYLAKLLDQLAEFSTVATSFTQNSWLNIKDNFYALTVDNEAVGSSTMPHKINPIQFENAEGQFKYLAGVLRVLAGILPISRLQRDLSDSTILRKVGVHLSEFSLGLSSLEEGLKKIRGNYNTQVMNTILEQHWSVLAEPVQTIMRKYGIPEAYEQLKQLTRHHHGFNKEQLHAFVDSQDKLPIEAKIQLKKLTPENYVGLAVKLTEEAIKKDSYALEHGEYPSNKAYIDVVVGAQWGDEGKGKIVDLKAASKRYGVVVRYNGGANAGHSIKKSENSPKIATHLMPSGILCEDVVNVIANGVVLDLWQLKKEIDELKNHGYPVTPDNLKVSERCHIVLPYFKEEDCFNEALLARNGNAIGTTKKGIGPTIASKAHRGLAIRFCDLFDDNILYDLLKRAIDLKTIYFNAVAQKHGFDFDVSTTKTIEGPNKEVLYPYDAEMLFKQVKQVADELKPYMEDTARFLQQQMLNGVNILIEGANAMQLDIDFGTYPYVTSSNASPNGISAGTGLPANCNFRQITGIVKAYSTRVGEGPFVTELHGNIAHCIREEGHEYGTSTGRPRRVGWLDLMPVAYGIKTGGFNTLSIMLLDVLHVVEEIKVCSSYELDGKSLEFGAIPANLNELRRCTPIYKTFSGFGDFKACRSYAELPQAAKEYLLYIEDRLQVPIEHVSYGPERNQTLFLPKGIKQADLKWQKSKQSLMHVIDKAIQKAYEIKSDHTHISILEHLKLEIEAKLVEGDLKQVKQKLAEGRAYVAEIATSEQAKDYKFFKPKPIDLLVWFDKVLNQQMIKSLLEQVESPKVEQDTSTLVCA